MNARRGRQRGFTLIELMVATGISVIVIAAAVALLMAQDRAFRVGGDDRALQEAGRLAIEEITGSLRSAGYGVDPALVFDFGLMPNAPMDRAPTGTVVRASGYACPAAVSCRDNVAQPDELVFYARDPAFGHRSVALPTAGQLSINGPLNAPLHRGQILQVMCYGGAMEWAYVTVGAEVAATANVVAPVVVNLAAGAANDFPLQNQWLTRTCFQSQPVRVFKVDRYRYAIESYFPTGALQPWGTPGARPFLVLDQGLFDAGGARIVNIVAPDVEDLQVTYLFPGAVAPALPAVPAVVGNQLANAAGGIQLAPAVGAPSFTTARNDPSRLTNHPANIRAVRVALVVRPPERSPQDGSANDNLLPAAGNRAAQAAPEVGYRHMLFETTTATKNMDARVPYIPGYSANGGLDTLNVGGG